MRWGRVYFALQAVAGLAWWIGVFTIPLVRTATLGGLDPVLVAVLDIPLFVVGSALAATGLRLAAIVATAWTALVLLGMAVYATVSTQAGWGVLAMAAATGASVLATCLVVLGRVPVELMVRGPFAFRAATLRRTATPHVVTTLVQLVLFWGLFLVVLPGAIVLLERRWRLALAMPADVLVAVRVVGLVALLLASALGVASAIAMSTRGQGTPLPSAMANRLVVVGPYRWVRNPMAVAGIVQGVAVGLAASSWLVVLYALSGSVLWNYAVRPLEEADLERRFGAQFRRYRDEVRCWVPRMPGAGPRG